MLNLKYNKYLAWLFLFLAYISVFNKPISGILNTELLKYIDEILLVLGILAIGIVVNFSERIKIIYLLIIGFFLYSVLISLAFGLNKQLGDIVLQSVINLKFFILILAFLVIFRDRIESMERFLRNVLILSLIGLFLNVVFGSYFNEVFDMPIYRRPSVPLRYGGFLNPNHMAFLMAMFTGTVLNKAKAEESEVSIRQWVVIVGSLAVIILTDSRTALVGVVVFFIAFYWGHIQRNANIFLSFVLTLSFLVIMLLVFSDIVENTWINFKGSISLDSYYIRGIIFNMALQISYFHFPIGTGAATFGSLLSDGSQVYEDFGVAERLFFTEKRGIYDSSIASVLGEYGVLGIIFYGIMFYFLYRLIRAVFSPYSQRLIGALFLAFFFYSFTNPTMTNNVYILISIPVFLIFSASHGPGYQKTDRSRMKF